MKKILFAIFAVLLVFSSGTSAQIMTEDFDSGTAGGVVFPPTGWILHGTAGSSWIPGTTPNGGLYNAATNVLIGGEAGLINCEWCTVPLVDPILEFWYRGGYSTSYVAFTAEISTTRCCPSQFVTVWDSGPFNLPDYNDSYTNAVIDMSAYAGMDVLVGFRCYQQDSLSYDLQLDDILLGSRTVNTALATESFDPPAPPPWPPTGWSEVVYTGTGAWIASIEAAHNPPSGAGFYAIADSDALGSGNTFNTGLQTYSMDMTGETFVTVEFDQNWDNIGVSDYAQVNVYSAGGLAATLAQYDNVTGDLFTHEVLSFDPSVMADPTDIVVEFLYNDGGSWAWEWSIDNVIVYGTATFLTEDFGVPATTFPPTGWTALTAGLGNTWYAGTSHDGGSANVDDGPLASTHQDEWLITPTIDCSTITSTRLTFWDYFYRSTASGDSTAEVLGSTDDGATWTQVIASWMLTDPSGNHDFDISAWADGQSQVKIAFRFTSTALTSDYDYWDLDDVWVGSIVESIVCSEDFEETQPVAWPTGWYTVLYSGDGDWNLEYAGSDTYEPPNAAGLYADCDDDDFVALYDAGLFSPAVDLTGLTSVNLYFDRAFQDFAGSGQAEVRTYSSGGLEAVLLWLDVDDPSGGVSTTLNFDPSGYADPSDVAFEWWYTDDGYLSAWKFAIDNVSVTAGPAPPPLMDEVGGDDENSPGFQPSQGGFQNPNGKQSTKSFMHKE